MKCKICDEVLGGNKTKFCSNVCKQKYHYKSSNTYFKQTVKYSTRKLEFINILGGSCSNCKYNKNVAALDFHHKDEATKRFPMDSRNLSNRNIEDLLLELKNCELLCANCHREHHNPDHEIETFKKFVQSNCYKPIIKAPVLNLCKFCNEGFKASTGKLFCSRICHEKSKMYPSKEDVMAELLTLKTKVKVGAKFGISTKVLRKILNS